MKKHRLRRHGIVIVILLLIAGLLGLAYVLSGFDEDVVGQATKEGDRRVIDNEGVEVVRITQDSAGNKIVTYKPLGKENTISRLLSDFERESQPFGPTTTGSSVDSSTGGAGGLGGPGGPAAATSPITTAPTTTAPATSAGAETPAADKMIIVGPTSRTGTSASIGSIPGRAYPSGFREVVLDKNGNGKQDADEQVIPIHPSIAKRIDEDKESGFNFELRGNEIVRNDDIVRHVISSDGRGVTTFFLDKKFSDSRYQGIHSTMILYENGVEQKEAFVDYKKVDSRLVNDIDLTAETINVVNENNVVATKGAQKTTHAIAGQTKTKSVETKNEKDDVSSKSYTETTLLDGGGTAEWTASGGTDFDKDNAQGTLTIPDGRGGTETYANMKKDGAGYKNADGTITADITPGKTAITDKSGPLDYHVIEIDANGDITDTEWYSDGKEIDEKFIYHKNGDWSEVNNPNVINKGYTENEFTVRYGRDGQANRFTALGNDKEKRFFVPADKYFKDKNGDRKVTRDEVPDADKNLFDKLDTNKNGEIDTLHVSGPGELTGSLTSSEDQGMVEVDKNGKGTDAKPENDIEQGGDSAFKKAQNENEWDRYTSGRSAAAYPAQFLDFIHGIDASAISNALFGDEWLNKWREDVDKAFAKKYLGVDHWTSEICRQEYDMQGDSVAFVETNQGLFQFIGTVQADRSDAVPLLCNADTSCRRGTCRTRDHVCVDNNGNVINEFFYKISYGVVAPNDQKLTPYYDEKGAISFNIVIRGREKTETVFGDFVNLKNGESAAQKVPKEAQSPILHYSPIVYDEVCILFEKKPVDRKGEPVRQICNPIVAAGGSFVNFRGAQGQAQLSEGPAVNPDW